MIKLKAEGENGMKQERPIVMLFTIATLYLVMELVFKITCPILFLTGISCAGCGMSRAWFCLLRLDVAGAFYYHPLFWLPPIAAILFFVREKIPKRLRKVLIIVACIVFLAVYVIRLLDPADSIVVFHPKKGFLFLVFSKFF